MKIRINERQIAVPQVVNINLLLVAFLFGEIFCDSERGG